MKMGIRLAQALRSGAIAVIFLSPAVAAQRASAAEVDAVAPAVASLRAWLDHQPNGKGWVDYLNLPVLETEVAKGKEANPKVGMDVLKALSSGAPRIRAATIRRVAEGPAGLAGGADCRAESEPGGSGHGSRSELSTAQRFGCRVRQSRGRSRRQPAGPILESQSQGRGRMEDIFRLEGSAGATGGAHPGRRSAGAIQKRFAADQVGLEMPVFADVGKALLNYLQLIQARQSDVQVQYVAHLKDLSEKLKQYDESKLQSTETAEAVGADWAGSRRCTRPSRWSARFASITRSRTCTATFHRG